jgi:thioredoxin 1
MDILIRFGMAIVIAVIGIGLYFAMTQLRLIVLRRSHRNVLGLDGWRSDKPTILYFSSPDCAPCQTIQHPALDELRAQYHERLQIIEVDASEKTNLANQWGVLTVPTTFIIDAKGQPRHVNNGVALADKLRQQLREFTGLEPIDSTRKAMQDKLATQH